MAANGRAQYRRVGDGGGAAPGTGNAVFAWGSRVVGSSTATRYLGPWVDDSMAPTTLVGFRAPRDGTIQNMYVRHGTPLGNGGTITYTVLVNGTPSSVTVGLASTSTSAEDTTNSVSVSAGDLVSIRVTKAAGVGVSPRDVTVTAEFD